MTGTKKSSIWFSTPNANRVRKVESFTLSPAASKRLASLAKAQKLTKSAMVEALIESEPLTPEARVRLARLAKLHGQSKSEVVEALIIGAPTLDD